MPNAFSQFTETTATAATTRTFCAEVSDMNGCEEVICPVCKKPMANFMMQLSRQYSGEGEDREMTHWKGIVKCCGSIFTIFND